MQTPDFRSLKAVGTQSQIISSTHWYLQGNDGSSHWYARCGRTAVPNAGKAALATKPRSNTATPISDFMKTLSQARLVIVVLSEKYLRSPYCMTELHALYKNARAERQAFLNRIIPLVLADARIGTWRDRAVHAKHWEAEFKAMEQDIPHLGEEDLKLYKAMRRWHNEVGDMLAYVNDVLIPHGFDEIVKDDFASLRQMLERRR
jgi:internalin A